MVLLAKAIILNTLYCTLYFNPIIIIFAEKNQVLRVPKLCHYVRVIVKKGGNHFIESLVAGIGKQTMYNLHLFNCSVLLLPFPSHSQYPSPSPCNSSSSPFRTCSLHPSSLLTFPICVILFPLFYSPYLSLFLSVL